MALMLEAFDAPPPPTEGAPAGPAGPTADWMLGHAAGLAEGLAAGEARAEAAGAALSRDLARSLQDMAFAYAEARGEVLGSLGPLVRLVLDRLLPEVAAEAVGAWLTDAVMAAARADSGRPLVIHVHPARLDAARACLRPGVPVAFAADATLGTHAARLARADRESELDLDACLQGVREALSTLLEPQPQAQARHG